MNVLIVHGRELLDRRGNSGFISSLSFSRDGKWVASAGGIFQKSGEVKVRETSNGRETRHRPMANGWNAPVVLSADGKRLAASSADKSVVVWDASTGQELTAFRGHTHCAAILAFSPDGNGIASAAGMSLVGQRPVWGVELV